MPLSLHPCLIYLKQIGFHELGIMRQPITSGILLCPAYQRRAALVPNYMRTTPRDRQAKVSQSTEKVGDAFPRLGIEQAQGSPHQYPIHGRVDLSEFGRMKWH